MQARQTLRCGVLAYVTLAALWAVPNDSRLVNAVQNQDRPLIRSLLKQHANVNSAQIDLTTPLMWAAHWNDGETVDLLLAAGADVKAANRYGISSLSEAAANFNGSITVLEKLLKAEANPNTVAQNNESVLMTLALAGSVDGVKLLLDHGANIDARDASDQETPLMYAVAEGRLPVVKLLISRGADVNIVAHALDLPRRINPTTTLANRYTGGFTALMFAARQDYGECAKALLDAGADPRVEDRYGMSALMIAAMNGSFETGALILEKGGDPNDGTLWEVMDFRNFKVDTHVEPRITSKLDPLEFAKMLLDHGADQTKPYGKIRTTNRTQGTNLVPPTNTSALDRALEAVDVESVRMMLASAKAHRIKVDPNEVLLAVIRAYSVIVPQVRPGGEELPKMVFRTVTVKDVADAISMTLEYGADVNAVNALGNTPMHLAAQQGADDIIKLLATQGAKLDVKNKAGLTPVDFALGKGGLLGRRRFQQDQGEPAEKPPVYEGTAALLRQLIAGPSARNSAPEQK